MEEIFKKLETFVRKNKSLAVIISIALALSFLLWFVVPKSESVSNMKYTEFLDLARSGEVVAASINPAMSTFSFTLKDGSTRITANPKVDGFREFLLLRGIDVKDVSSRDDLWPTLAQLAIIGVGIWFIYHRTRAGSRGHKNMTKPAAVNSRVSFERIAGNHECKEEMEFLVKFLKNPRQYASMGAKLPKGVVFYGPPGTGKTLTARVIAAQANVPFFSISGSDFVEMYVGVGARRVRDLFKNARKHAPCIVFIDEIDAVGSKRGGENHSEKDQTINALLNELDGFDGSEGVVVIAATNRIDTLDLALVRPGRFDKHIPINLPDHSDRLEILRLHAENKPLRPDVNLEILARMTIGFSGAGLESLLNEAAILTVNRDKTEIGNEEIDDAYYKVVMRGSKKCKDKCLTRDEDEIRLVAWHEAGHALCAKLVTDYEVPKVSIVPSTSGAGGVTLITPKKMGLQSRKELYGDIMTRYAGRAAEFLLLGDMEKTTTGAAMDIQQASESIKAMISSYGMNDALGMLNLEIMQARPEVVMAEASKLARELYDRTQALLTENRATLEAIATRLIDQENINEDELDRIIAGHQAAA